MRQHISRVHMILRTIVLEFEPMVVNKIHHVVWQPQSLPFPKIKRRSSRTSRTIVNTILIKSWKTKLYYFGESDVTIVILYSCKLFICYFHWKLFRLIRIWNGFNNSSSVFVAHTQKAFNSPTSIVLENHFVWCTVGLCNNNFSTENDKINWYNRPLRHPY